MNFTSWLKDDSKIILFDGGMGTELIKRGLDPGKVLDLHNIENPNTVREILASYYQAGSDMVQSCTFSSNLVNLEKHGVADRLMETNSKALENLKAVCPKDKLIVGDIGPSGEFRPPVGQATGEEWENGFRTQIEVLEPGVDLWHVETMSDIQEILAAVKAVKSVSKKPIIASMTYRKSKRGYFTIMGDSLENCVEILENNQVDVIGANCTLTSDQMIELAGKLVELTSLPVSIKPNAGQPRLEGGKTTYAQKPEDYAEDIKKMIEMGVKIVGGCCGTSPAHIKLLREYIDAL
ncbi:MAG: homocysteine S-methyltransferase family protein [Candidatus Odinarchaeota archaeon]